MQPSYTSVLQQSYQARVKQNPRYSMRSFARDIGLAPSTLSEILKGKKGLSPAKADQVGSALRLPDWQLNRFRSLVAKDYSRTKKSRSTEAKPWPEASEKTISNIEQLKNQAVESLTSWLDLAILESTHLKDFQASASWLAASLGATQTEVEKSCSRLIDSGLLKITESLQWIDASPFFTTTDGTPSASIRSFHQSVLKILSEKIDRENVEQRTVKSVVFSLEQENIAIANGIIDEAVAKILALADSTTNKKDHVVCFGSYLFKISKDER